MLVYIHTRESQIKILNFDKYSKQSSIVLLFDINDTHGLKSGRQVAVRHRNSIRRRSSSVKLAAPHVTCTKKEQRSVICFLSSEWVKPIEIHRRMKVQ